MADERNSERQDQLKPAVATPNQFGTFAGVFTPSILTILGVIMFMRTGFVVGEAGLGGALAVLVIANLVTLLSALSISAISTNMQVRGGGAYFLISRVLGPEFGGAIGLALFFAQALSVPFYILGFTEALVHTIGGLDAYFEIIGVSVALALFVLSYIGANWAIRTQFAIMAVLGVSILVLFAGAGQLFNLETLQTNWGAGYTALHPQEAWSGNYSFWIVFAIYFPAVTGILAGVNMSGDLRDPSRSIPKGTLAAICVSFLIYVALMIVCAGAFDREQLIARPYRILKESAFLQLGFLVAAGVFAASLSSALGSYMGAPRILQSVARDRIIAPLRFFARGSLKGDEPRRALCLTGVLTALVLMWAGNSSSGEALNAVAMLITMFFLYTYGMINLAAFIETVGRNPSFRPRFRFFHWWTALLGTIGCVSIAFIIDARWAAVAALVVAGLLWFIKTRELQTTFGDARRGFVFQSVRKNLLKLAEPDNHPKNWRPTILVFSGNPQSRETLVSYSVWLEAGRGIVFLANVMRPEPGRDIGDQRRQAQKQLKEFCDRQGIQAFPIAAMAHDTAAGIAFMLQTTAVGPIRPNLAMFGWGSDAKRFGVLAEQLRLAHSTEKSLVLLRDRGVPPTRGSKRIDVWWRGHANGGLMLILAHLLTLNWEWARATIRVLRVVDNNLEEFEAVSELRKLIAQARVDAEPVASLRKDESYAEVIYRESRTANCVFLGFEIPKPDQEEQWHARYRQLLKGLPTTLLVNSCGAEDVYA